MCRPIHAKEVKGGGRISRLATGSSLEREISERNMTLDNRCLDKLQLHRFVHYLIDLIEMTLT
jgi:hypothetical protein